LNSTILNLPTCQASLRSQINNNAGSLIQNQFGIAMAEARVDWISFWRRSGATFGCAGLNLETCPQAYSCFGHLHQTFAPVLNFPGGVTALGNNKSSIMGRFTPQYSPSFVASELVATIYSLTQWSTTMQSFEHYVSLVQLISKSAKQQDTFTQAAINITLQVQAVSASTSLQSNYLLGMYARCSNCPFTILCSAFLIFFVDTVRELVLSAICVQFRSHQIQRNDCTNWTGVLSFRRGRMYKLR
jgi:hypothetical protein